ncbi:tryptophan synthase subunit beta [Pseudoteredinibacter isoporae]|uniref:Tryptophan synthase beta chain n=1 Tax=Pseudoteredinibacter isoporae TaxID=570281 RepID=A0A7X0MUS3_9GAMM|nr:tryptophan synthase subunit beta [Pseudoteredinibacter isoporae]MBB6520966.1 tryptophan synthase beta chain [Pseudoteredinibacter isoporae]NHO86531.1 tryptophan synthase subunit beta [Pseudoteredinibacter isoporae]NIB25017.1 tryptophan synthase subunit beta [Pseudoteredinibacter isoporae]
MDLFDFEPGREGYYGEYGGCFLPEILTTTIEELKAAFQDIKHDPSFWQEFEQLMQSYSGRPTPVSYLANLSAKLGGAQIYVKREDLNHTGSHKINNVMGQGLLCKRIGKSRVIAETGAGQHGFATATMAARFGFDCKIYMGAVDVARQRPNVFWMENLGAEVVAVQDGQQTLKDAINECLRDWVTNMHDTHYVLGTAAGPHPFPEMVSYFQSIIGREARGQIQKIAGKLPDRVFACVGGGSNAMGLFQGFLDDQAVELVGCEAGGLGPGEGNHASRLAYKDASVGVAQGFKTYFLQNKDGNMLHTKSVAAGLDYIGVNPALVHLWEQKRVRFEAVTDAEVTEALKLCMKTEGLIPALESSHAFARAIEEASKMSKDEVILINQSGRGDKDIFTVADALDDDHWKSFIKTKAEHYGA